jgi:DNA-directed RNA polymerase sigma subunit (sigma70/sigma32)
MKFILTLSIHLFISTIAFIPINRIKFVNNINYENVLRANPRKLDIGEISSSPKELMNHALLTAEDENLLARQYKIAAHINLQRAFHPTDQEIANILGIPVDQIPHLVTRGDQAKKMLVQANMRLVMHIAKYYKFRYLNLKLLKSIIFNENKFNFF